MAPRWQKDTKLASVWRTLTVMRVNTTFISHNYLLHRNSTDNRVSVIQKPSDFKTISDSIVQC